MKIKFCLLRSLALLLFVSILPVFANAESDCAISSSDDAVYGALSFTLTPSNKLRKLQQKKKAANDVLESASDLNGTRLRVHQSGCTHHLTTVELTGDRAQELGKTSRSLADYLQSLPLIKDGHLQVVIEDISKVKAFQNRRPIKCGSSICTIERKPGSVILIDDFPI